MKKYLIIGNGIAGTTAADNIRRNDAAGEIIIVTDEDLPFYYRIRLPDLLGGRVTESELIAKNSEWYRKKNISLKLNTRITAADPQTKKVHTGVGESLAFDRLLLANGSHPFIPPVKGSDMKGVFAIHTVNDVRRVLAGTAKLDNALLVGGGLLGLEAANALHRLGKKITVIEFFPRLLPRQLDDEGATRLQRYFEKMGFSFRLEATVREIRGSGHVEDVVLEDGTVLPAGMVIISAGVRPSLELAQMFSLKIDKGVIVNKHMQTSNPDIFAAGDVIEFNGKTYGIWPAAMEQGKIAGTNISGGNTTYGGTTLSNILKVAGVDLGSAGEIDIENRYKSKTVATSDIYKKVVIDNNRVIGCIMLGNLKNFNRISMAITTGENILDELDSLLGV